ncbi:MAG: bacteriocin-like protein [Pseudohongiellaceae bacterium]
MKNLKKVSRNCLSREY